MRFHTIPWTKTQIAVVLFLIFFFGWFWSPSHAMETVRVVHIADGDTVRLEDKRWVRLSGIDAPEVIRDGKGSCAGEISKRALADLLGKSFVFLDEKGKDRYGRTLGRLHLPDGRCVNDEMIRLGMAWVFVNRGKAGPAEIKQIALQREAINMGLGIWARLPKTSPAVLGNRNSYRFHETQCGQAKKIAKKNRIPFATYRDAFLEGYAPARECVKDPVCPLGLSRNAR